MSKVICVLALVLAGILLTSCAAEDNAAAERAARESQRISAEAEAYQSRVAADTNAAAERAAIREAQRQAGHERVLELLPFVVAILAAAGLAGIGLLVWSRPRQAPQAPQAPAVDPGLVLLLLDAERRRLAESERAAWRIVAAKQRRQLVGDRRVTVYGDCGAPCDDSKR